MSKVITSPYIRWAGTVTIADPMFLPQAEAFEASMTLPDELKDKKGNISLLDIDRQRFPALLACVESWDLDGIPNPPTFETFPLSPRPDSHEIQDWIWREIRTVYLGELKIPNGSRLTPTVTQAKANTPKRSRSSKPLNASE